MMNTEWSLAGFANVALALTPLVAVVVAIATGGLVAL